MLAEVLAVRSPCGHGAQSTIGVSLESKGKARLDEARAHDN